MDIKREHHFNFWYLVVAFIGVTLVQNYIYQRTQIKTLLYSEFEQLVAGDKVTDIVIGTNYISGSLKEIKTGEAQYFRTIRVPSELAEKLTAAHIPFSGEPPPGLMSRVRAVLLIGPVHQHLAVKSSCPQRDGSLKLVMTARKSSLSQMSIRLSKKMRLPIVAVIQLDNDSRPQAFLGLIPRHLALGLSNSSVNTFNLSPALQGNTTLRPYWAGMPA